MDAEEQQIEASDTSLSGAAEIQRAESTTSPTPHSADRFVKHAHLMSGLTLLSRVFGLLRDKACAMYLGNKTTEWSAFWMGFQLPNLFRRIFGEGALTAVFVPVYTKILHERGKEEANKLASATATLLVLVLGSLTILGEAIILPFVFSGSASGGGGGVAGIPENNRLAAAMIAIMLPYCVMVCLVALMGAMATVHEKFTAQSISPIILNLFITVAAVIPVWFLTTGHTLRQRIFWVAWAVVIAGIIQIAQMLPTLWRSGISLRPLLDWRHSGSTGLREIVTSMTPMILGLSAVQFNTYMDTQIAWWLSPDGHKNLHQFALLGFTIHTPMEQGAVGILSVAQRLYLLPVGIFGVSMATAIFPQMAKAAAIKDLTEVKRLLIAGLRKTLFISIPASIGMILIARPLITIIYTADGIDRSTWAAIWFCAGIWAFEAQMVILRAYYALSDRITPMKVAASMVALNFALNLTLVWFLQEGGIALSTTLSAILQVVILLGLLRQRLGRLGLSALGVSLLKELFASALMAIAVLETMAILHQFRGPSADQHAEKLLSALIDLPIILVIAIGSYAFLTWALNMPELHDLLRKSKRKTPNPIH